MEKLSLLGRRKEFFWKLVFLFLGALFLSGGLDVEKEIVQYFGVLVGALILALVFLRRKELKLPAGFFLYALFLLFFAASILWSQGRKESLENFSLFLSGGLFWVAFYNIRKDFGRNFDLLLLALGIVFGGLFLGATFVASHYSQAPLIKSWSLYTFNSAYKNHNHIGDLWAVVLVLVAYKITKHRKIAYWALVPMGAYFLVMSQSRSAYVALAVGIAYLAKNLGWTTKYKKHKKTFSIFVLLSLILFLGVGTQKSVLLSRPYFVQTLLGFIHNPLGIGVGNFGIISKDPANHILGLTHFSSVTHNIFLEIIAGMGVFAAIFIAWLVKVFQGLWESRDSKRLLYRAIFFVLSANFFFDSTYFIPTMLWLWFTILALAQNRVRR